MESANDEALSYPLKGLEVFCGAQWKSCKANRMESKYNFTFTYSLVSEETEILLNYNRKK